jgi:two-component system sensor histidine kinase RegB
MSDLDVLEPGRGGNRLRLDTLVRLRWLAVAGQSLAILLVQFGLDFDLPVVAAALTIAAAALLNLALGLVAPQGYRLSDTAAAGILIFDIVQLAVLLGLTGGLENPFAMLLLAPVMISATALPLLHTVAVGCSAIVSASVVGFLHMPLPWSEDGFSAPWLYDVGIWFAIMIGAIFTGTYAFRVAEESRRLAGALAATELVLAREQHLSQLDGLAAAAAHELGTPLATIALIAKELERSVPPEGDTADDVRLLGEQVRRCREILGKLNSLESGGEGPLETMTLLHLVEEVASPHRSFGVEITVENRGTGPEPICRRNPAILYGLGNFVENAVDFAREEVRITTSRDADRVAVSIVDDGPGFPADLLPRLGEPYLRPRGRRRAKDGGGLGLGLFIAKTLLERSGGFVSMRNAPDGGRGAEISIVWARAAFERNVAVPAARRPGDAARHRATEPIS